MRNTSRNNAGDPDQLKRMSASTTACPKASAESPTTTAASEQTGYREGFWMGLTSDESPLRDVGTEEIYSLDLTTHQGAEKVL
jgi:hypothetical protein